MKLSDYIIEFVAQQHVKHIFMLPGGGAMHLVDSAGRNNDIEYICALHEQGAAIMAEAYGQYTNRPGVVLVTTGPGGTNTVTGLAGGWIDSTPMLFISGQAKTDDLIADRGVRQMGIQEVDIISVVKPLTKYAVTVIEPETIRYHLEKALYEATHERKGPVWIDIPLDVQGSEIEPEKLEGFTPEQKSCVINISDDMNYLLNLIKESEKPAVLAGNGIRLSDAMEKFDEVIDKLQIPVLTTWKMADALPEDHPLFCGRPGSIAQRGANIIQQQCDLLLILGARLDLCQTGFNHADFARSAKKIIVEIDKNEINKLEMRFEMKFCCNVGFFLDNLAGSLTDYRPAHSRWLRQAKALYEKYPVVLPKYKNAAGPVNTYNLIDVLSEMLTEKDLIVPGSSGDCAEKTLQAFKIKKGQRLLNTPGLGAMGFGLPAAIGACIASGRQRTISIVGDGGIQMNIQELQTLKRLNLPIIIFILNNGGYGSIYHMQKNRFNGNFVACNPASGLELPDFAKLAKAYGLNYAELADNKTLKADLKAVLEEPMPLICEVMADLNVPTVPRIKSEVLPDGRIISKPMDELHPAVN